ncbi:HEPN domain-containing protein [Acidobacteria bacterium AH-259-D05]|nr:HEPN domain-containing protein [Acidobacteria bacterium AH-259-D05]
MTEENKRINIREELERAEKARQAAELLADNAYLLDAISRWYYWVYHTIKALLFSEGLEPKTHEGALTLLSLHFVKNGRFAPSSAHIFSRLMKFRQEADYNPSYIFTPADYQDLKKEGEGLCDHIRQYLQERRYI